MSRYCVIGKHGFIGGAIAKATNATSQPTPETKVLFHFASHCHMDFDQNPDMEIRQVIASFAEWLPYCYEHGIVFVYPSSALVYEKDTRFARFKRTLEAMAGCYKTASVGLRIFPVYGPGERRTVISQWCARMAAGMPPVVYGDGNQSRDFIHIDDVVRQVLQSISQPWSNPRVVDIGTGQPTTFNRIVEIINGEMGTRIDPIYQPMPEAYSAGIRCGSVDPAARPIAQGIREVIACLGKE